MEKADKTSAFYFGGVILSSGQVVKVIKIEDKEKLLSLSSIEKRNTKVEYKCEKCNKIINESVLCFMKKQSLVCGKCTTQIKRSAKIDEIKRKVRETNLQRYGTVSNLSTMNKERKARGELLGAADPKIKEKMRQTNLEKYGVDNCSNFGRKDVKDKIKQTFIEKYGVDHNFKIKEFKDKRAAEAVKRNQKYRNSPDYIKFFIDRYINQRNLILMNTFLKDDETYYDIKCPECGETFTWSIKDRINGGHQYPYCEKCNRSGKSKEEKELYDFVKSIYNGPIITNDRKALNGKEIDIYLPERKFGIEYNGLYWHAGDKTRHREKWEAAQAAGIDLMQIWSCEWEQKRPILESIIKNRLGLATPIYARKCKIKEVPLKEAKDFANANHMQGFYHGMYVGLYYDNELVDMSIFCENRFGGKYDWELTRHVIKHGVRVIGGLSKELKYFRRIGHHGDIVDYCDMRLFNGKGHWSFEEVGITPPDMQYTDFVRIIPRGKYQKRNMPKIPGFKYDPSKTQLENLHDNGMDFIYGVGHKIFVQKENTEN